MLVLDFSTNQIKLLSQNCFYNMTAMKSINISNNAILLIESFSFKDLCNVDAFDLSSNFISHLPSHFITSNCQRGALKYFSIKSNPILYISMKFLPIPVYIVEADTFRVCCATHGDFCLSQKAWFESCSDLLATFAMKLSMISVSLVIIMGNILSFVLHIYALHEKPGTGTYLIICLAINCSDLCLGVYMTIIWSVDITHRGNFAIWQIVWKSHPLCYFALAVSLLFSLSSPMFLTFLSVSRIMVVISPFITRFKRKRFVVKCLASIGLLAVLTSIYPILHCSTSGKRIATSLCTVYGGYSKMLSILDLTAILQSVLQLSGSFAIFMVYALLIYHLKVSVGIMYPTRDHKSLSKSMITQLLVLTFSNIVCWLPSSVIYIYSVFASDYPLSMLVWTTIAIMPINSVINPFVLIVVTVRKLLAKSQ